MKPEAKLWRDLSRTIKDWIVWRIETKATNPGVADIYILRPLNLRGWLELKIGTVAARGGVIRTPHFTEDQRNFLITNIRNGQMGALLLRVTALNSHWLLTTERAIEMCGYVTAAELDQLAAWKGEFLSKEILNVQGWSAEHRKVLQEVDMRSQSYASAPEASAAGAGVRVTHPQG